MATDGGIRTEARCHPALEYRWLTPLYDSVLRWAFREDAIKSALVAKAAVLPAERVLDLGCGTGTLAMRLKRSQPRAAIVGLNGDPDVLAIAKRKASSASAEIEWNLGPVDDLPFNNKSFDTAIASLMLHHLTQEAKAPALREVHRILRSGGRFLVADFGPPQGTLMRGLAGVSELLEETEDGVEGRLPDMFRSAGLARVREPERFRTPLGKIALFESERPRGPRTDDGFRHAWGRCD